MYRRYDDNPEIKEVNFENEIDRIWFSNKFGEYFNNDAVDFARIRTICKYFYEFGLKAQRSSISIPNIDDIFEEDGIDPNSKTAKIFKESYYTALERLNEWKGE